MKGGDIGYSDIKLIAKSLYGDYEVDDGMKRVLRNSKYRMLNKHSLTGPRFEEDIEVWYKALEEREYTVDKRETEGGYAVGVLV